MIGKGYQSGLVPLASSRAQFWPSGWDLPRRGGTNVVYTSAERNGARRLRGVGNAATIKSDRGEDSKIGRFFDVVPLVLDTYPAMPSDAAISAAVVSQAGSKTGHFTRCHQASASQSRTYRRATNGGAGCPADKSDVVLHTPTIPGSDGKLRIPVGGSPKGLCGYQAGRPTFAGCGPKRAME